jgi:hypothetical protein
MKKILIYCSYLIVLYYLLPFSPIYLYYVSNHKTTNTSLDYNFTKSTKFLSNKIELKSDAHHFVKKDKSRFDLDNNILVPANFIEFVLVYTKVKFSYLDTFHSSSLTLNNSNRGPPLV